MAGKSSFRFLTKPKIQELFRILAGRIDPKPELRFSTAFELLVAVVLSAQCTDKNVNRVTDVLWQTLKKPEDYLKLGEEKLAKAIHSIGLYRAKAAHLIGLCRMLLEKFEGEVPATREELMQLPGVGRKTANVVLNCWFHQPTLAVDTHVARVARRTGLSSGTTPEKVEQDLLKLVPEEYLLNAHHYLLLHGRYCCKAQKAQCQECPLLTLCSGNQL